MLAPTVTRPPTSLATSAWLLAAASPAGARDRDALTEEHGVLYLTALHLPFKAPVGGGAGA